VHRDSPRGIKRAVVAFLLQPVVQLPDITFALSGIVGEPLSDHIGHGGDKVTHLPDDVTLSRAR